MHSFLKMTRGHFRVIFYCHHPDKLLTTHDSLLKKIYRAPLSWLEEITTAKADKVLVNSKYTARVYKDAFQRISDVPEICYPSINTEFFKNTEPKALKEVVPLDVNKFIILSINRYERKKNLSLALYSLRELKENLNDFQWDQVHLIMAGGFDPINVENLEHFIELTDLAVELNLEDKVTFLKSPNDHEKLTLLYHCRTLLYTPSNEHFGIVPLEAMYFGKPVIAVNSGGPTETVVNDVTGYLCQPTPESFANAVRKLILNPDIVKSLGEAGKKRFVSRFSFDAFSEQLDGILGREREIVAKEKAADIKKDD